MEIRGNNPYDRKKEQTNMAMCKFLGLPEPSLKRNCDAKERNKIYDNTKRQRTIVSTWKEEFNSWLVTDDTRNIIFCKPCRAVYGPLVTSKRVTSERFKKYSKGPFVVGCKNLRRDALTTHEKSSGHAYAVDFQRNKHAAPGQSKAEQCLQQLNRATFDRLEKLFRNAHAVAMNSRPLSDYVWMCTLDEMKGVELGHTYKNDKSCKEFLVAISEVERQKIESKLSAAKFCTIMSDGSTDISVVENEIVYIHFATRGISYCYVLGLIECATANAEGIYNAIMKAIIFKDLSDDEMKKKIVAFAADGASVNTGNLNGVISLLRQRLDPKIIMVKCMAHRVELAYKDVLKGVSLFSKVTNLLDGLFKFYHHSAKQMACLKSVFKALNIKQFLPTRVGGTRWLAHIKTALNSLWNSYRAYIEHLGQVALTPSQSASQSKAKFLLKLLRSAEVIVFAHFLTDVVSTLAKFSLALQKSQTCVYQVHMQLESTISNISKLKSRPGPELRKIEACQGEFQGENLVGNSTSTATQIAKVIDGLKQSLEKRFNDIDQSILRATRLADFESWPVNLEENADFGDEDLSVFIDHFRDTLTRNDIDVGSVESEWTELKNYLYSNQNIQALSWSKLYDLYEKKYPNFLQVIDFMLSLPAGTSECERGFSQMKIVKTCYRNKLKSSSMTLLLTIKLHSDDIKSFNPTNAIHQWNINGHRRPYFMETKVVNLNEQIELLHDDIDVNSDQIQENVDKVDFEKPDSDYDSDFSDFDYSSDSAVDDDNDDE